MATSIEDAPRSRRGRVKPTAAEKSAERNAATSTAAKKPAVADDVVAIFQAAAHGTRVDGLPFFCEAGDALTAGAVQLANVHSLSVAALGDTKQSAAVKALLRRVVARDGIPTTEKKGIPVPPAAYHSEARQRTVMRTDWSRSAAELALDWSQPEIRIEFCVGGRELLRGVMGIAVEVDGAPARPTTAWEEVCWESNVDVDYLELEIALGAHRLQRQFILTRRDGLLFVADTVLLATRGKVRCELRLPVAGDVQWRPAAEMREGLLTNGKAKALVIPPTLPEWRSEKRGGELEVDAGGVALSQITGEAHGLHLPLMFVYDSRRAGRECTWRQLTVGEDMQIVAPDKAAAIRLQIGNEHWLAYRSLTERANRTFMGINLQTNFLLTRFTKSGESEPLVEIDD